MSFILQSSQVDLGDITFGVVDEFGVEWILEDLRGWTDAASTTGSVEQRAGDHGGWIGQAFYGSRLLEIEGTLIAPDSGEAAYAVQRLMAAIPLASLEPLTVHSEVLPSMRVMVRQEGDPLTEQIDHHAEFSLSLLAPDPRRYALESTASSTGLPVTTGGLALPISPPFAIPATVTGGVLVVTNGGNMDTPPVLTVTGPCPPFSITHAATGRTIRYHDEVLAGQTVTIDARARTATIDGAVRYVTGAWFDYAPGVNGLAFNAVTYNAGAVLTSTHHDAWK